MRSFMLLVAFVVLNCVHTAESIQSSNIRADQSAQSASLPTSALAAK